VVSRPHRSYASLDRRSYADPLNGPGVPARFRTIQVRSKDLAVALRQRVVCEFIVVMLGGRMPVAAIRRREFLTLLGGAAAGCPLTGRAQQIGKLPTIGFLGPNARPAASEWVAALVQRLGELGWIEGRNITIAYRWAEGIDERFAEIAAEFVRLKVDVIVTSGTPAVMALRQATSVIPIVFATAGDPVGNNLVASLARPGANITGLATLAADLAGKRLEILREVVPGLGRLAIMGNAANPFTVLEMGEVKTAARTLGLEVAILEIRERRISQPPSTRSRATRTRSMSVPMDSRAPTESESTWWRWVHKCRRCTGLGTTSKREASCPLAQIFQIYSDALPIMLTRYCTGRSLPTSQLNSRPNSISL